MSSEDLLTKFDELVKRFKQEFEEIIETERAKMKAEVETFNEEKKRMQAFVVRDDDIIHLNVGGQKFTTKRTTLCQVEGSLFATMFSGRWENDVERDQDGAVFFDFNPQYFAYILDYLREKKITSGQNLPLLPDFPESKMKRFYSLVQYLGLSDELVTDEKFNLHSPQLPKDYLKEKKIVTSENPPSLPKVPEDQRKRFYSWFDYFGSCDELVTDERFNLHSPGVTLEENGKVAVHDGTNQLFKYALGKNIYRYWIESFKFKLESFRNDYCIFIGIVNGDVEPPDSNSYGWPSSYGWTLGCAGGAVKKKDSWTWDKTLKNLTKQGDVVKLLLDCVSAKLSLHLITGHEFRIDIPKNKTWRLNVNLRGANDKIRIINK